MYKGSLWAIQNIWWFGRCYAKKKDISRVTYNFLERFAYVTCGIKPEFDYNIILVCHPEMVLCHVFNARGKFSTYYLYLVKRYSLSFCIVLPEPRWLTKKEAVWCFLVLNTIPCPSSTVCTWSIRCSYQQEQD